MNVGPLRRTTGVAGLLALVPVLLQLAAGTISARDAAVRAVATAAVAVLLGHVARVVLTNLLRHVERRASDQAAEEPVRSAA